MLRLIRRRRVKAIIMGTPCASFSIARDRTAVTRNIEFPWGVPNPSDKDAEKIRVGNELARFSIKVFKTARRLGLPAITENPFSSKLWRCPPYAEEIDRGLKHQDVVFLHTDFCQWGTRWKKPTGLLTANLKECHTKKLSCQCSGPPGICSRTGRRHFVLTGSAPGGKPWTLVAQPYPKPFSASLAAALWNPSLPP